MTVLDYNPNSQVNIHESTQRLNNNRTNKEKKKTVLFYKNFQLITQRTEENSKSPFEQDRYN